MVNFSEFGIRDFDVEESAKDDYAPIPAGKYSAIITDSEMKETKAGTGHYLKLSMQICDGPFDGRKLWVNLNLDNPSQKAMEIARKDLAMICQALGYDTLPADTNDLHDKPMGVVVIVKPYDGKDKNEVNGFFNIRHAPAPSSTPKKTEERKALRDFGLDDEPPF